MVYGIVLTTCFRDFALPYLMREIIGEKKESSVPVRINMVTPFWRT
jgi:hypothetical protein